MPPINSGYSKIKGSYFIRQHTSSFKLTNVLLIDNSYTKGASLWYKMTCAS